MTVPDSKCFARLSSERGFSLIEMLVAMAIMGVALSALYQSAMGSTRNARVSAEYSQAVALAESTMDDFSAQLVVGKEDRGQFGNFEWAARADSLGAAGMQGSEQNDMSEENLALVTVWVSWAGDSNPREISLQSVGRISDNAGDS